MIVGSLKQAALRNISTYSESLREVRARPVRWSVCRVTAGRRVSKEGRKLIAETSEVRSWPSYLFLHSITCHDVLLHSTLAFPMHGRFNHERPRKYHWALGRRPDDHPGLSDLGF